MPFSLHFSILSLALLILSPSFSSSHRLSSILSRQRSVCPCVCVVNAPKNPDLCAAVPQPHSCKQIRCTPRSNGFACCDTRFPDDDPVEPTPTPSRTPVPAPKKPSEVTPNIFRIRNNGKSAARSEPRLADRAREILLECSKQLDLLAEPVPVTVRILGADVVRMRTTSGSFKRFNKASRELLLYIVSSLTLHSGRR